MSRAARGLSAAEAAAWSSSPRALARVLQGDLNAIVARCLEHDPARRYTTVDALKRDLTRGSTAARFARGPVPSCISPNAFSCGTGGPFWRSRWYLSLAWSP
jgi:hypothetical protein